MIYARRLSLGQTASPERILSARRGRLRLGAGDTLLRDPGPYIPAIDLKISFISESRRSSEFPSINSAKNTKKQCSI